MGARYRRFFMRDWNAGNVPSGWTLAANTWRWCHSHADWWAWFEARS